MYREAFERIVSAIPATCQAVYGDRLRALALYGSVARGTMRPDSDIDLLIVAEPLPEAFPDVVREAQEAVELVLKECYAGWVSIRPSGTTWD